MTEPDAFILEYEHEKFRPREAEALQLLMTVGYLVKPIMKKRGWKVEVLCEFFHPKVRILGLNGGPSKKIFLCLRDFNNEQEFLPLDDIVDTMLHELGHMVHEGHGLDFCMLWKQLREEYNDLNFADYKADEPPPADIKETWVDCHADFTRW